MSPIFGLSRDLMVQSSTRKSTRENFVINRVEKVKHVELCSLNVENAAKFCKSLLMKAHADKQGPFLALLEWRNTPTEGMYASPSELLYSGQTRTRLPVAKTLLEPRVITNVPEMIEMRKQEHYYDQHTQELPKLDNDDAIRMRLPGEKGWSLGQVIGDVGNRSYLVEVNGKQYRRDRPWLRATPEKLEPPETSEPTELTEQTETSSVE